MNDISPTLTAAKLVSELYEEIERLRKERDTYRARSIRADQSWASLRELLDLGPEQSVFDAVDKLVNR